ncbi:sulfite exporter TauE/SafE family protein [Bradyrhizobium sp. NP1]|uniref:sulfite exporter TauE/SafE family protein n=1 Tax=Bradyrhizobium sp. NP1 TaxID=3049772 RepID=UPI0025A60B79|nr:sulfite exporter TauE/SafE family protein [Bradyrhizobium sp. NP1]WJR75868.1 sulfite exporter TauE/SafE family protein [Bradyrhizobium sp. NP1]
MTPTELAGALAVVTFAGVLRGITGFGGAMMITPLLSILAGPVPAVVIALILETSAALVMFADAIPKAHWKVLAYLAIPTIFTVPLGGYLLLTLDPVLARKVIAVVVIVCSTALLFGIRYSGRPRATTSLLLGSIVGAMLGATSVGAPPVILYLLSGPDPAAVTRANLSIFVTAISVIGLVMLAIAGAITVKLALTAALLVVPFLLSTWLGGKLFTRLNDAIARHIALGLMMTAGIISLLS